MEEVVDRRRRPEFEPLLEQHRGILFKVANLYGLGPADRDDLAQEIRLQLWRSFPRYDPERRFSTWMYRVALNTAISHARARRRDTRLVPLDEPAASAAAPVAGSHDPRIEELYRLLRGLPELDRALVLLHLEDRSHRDIGEVLGLSESNVGTKISRIKQALRRDVARGTGEANGTR